MVSHNSPNSHTFSSNSLVKNRTESQHPPAQRPVGFVPRLRRTAPVRTQLRVVWHCSITVHTQARLTHCSPCRMKVLSAYINQAMKCPCGLPSILFPAGSVRPACHLYLKSVPLPIQLPTVEISLLEGWKQEWQSSLIKTTAVIQNKTPPE